MAVPEVEFIFLKYSSKAVFAALPGCTPVERLDEDARPSILRAYAPTEERTDLLEEFLQSFTETDSTVYELENHPSHRKFTVTLLKGRYKCCDRHTHQGRKVKWANRLLLQLE